MFTSVQLGYSRSLNLPKTSVLGDGVLTGIAADVFTCYELHPEKQLSG